jgi:hypothetical protein
MSKDHIGEKKEVPQWRGDANENHFIAWMSVLLVIGLLLLGLFIILGFPG